MSNLSDNIEKYLKELINKNSDRSVSIKRKELAYKFNCVPSQINYVLSTRFTENNGYLVTSRRGGGGYIEIKRLKFSDYNPEYKITELIGSSISQNEASGLIRRFYEEEIITKQDKDVLLSCCERESLPIPLPIRDRVRATLLKNVLLEILKHK
ncbi:transcriptional regulator [Natranaerobius trueperi]|uniref:Transcriptional regulator CtsR n=2 Tax=Natranaerobius trueperi TaxID=759412 RepID=A0A226BZS8_9FIRM|nr:transcriptional regulator [Natranaerobius trueperi]